MPNTYQPADYMGAILEWVSEGKTLRAYCKQAGKPSFNVVYKWLREDEQFAADMTLARECGADVIAEEALAIADTQEQAIRTKEGPLGTETVVEDALGHRKLRVWTRLQLLAKWNPKKYGDRTTLAGDKDNPLIPAQLTDEERAAKIAAIMNAATARQKGTK